MVLVEKVIATLPRTRCVSANLCRAAAGVRSWNKVPICIVSSCREKTDDSSFVHSFSWLLYTCSWRSRHALQVLFRPHLRKPLIAGWLRKEFFYLSQDHSYFPDTPYGTDSALWFTDSADKIGHITTQGQITEFALSTWAHPTGITTGPDGALWFTESNLDKIGRITTQGRITEFTLSTAAGLPE